MKPSDIQGLKDIERFPFINKKTQRDSQGVGSFLGELAAVPEEDVNLRLHLVGIDRRADDEPVH